MCGVLIFLSSKKPSRAQTSLQLITLCQGLRAFLTSEVLYYIRASTLQVRRNLLPQTPYLTEPQTPYLTEPYLTYSSLSLSFCYTCLYYSIIYASIYSNEFQKSLMILAPINIISINVCGMLSNVWSRMLGARNTQWTKQWESSHSRRACHWADTDYRWVRPDRHALRSWSFLSLFLHVYVTTLWVSVLKQHQRSSKYFLNEKFQSFSVSVH